jgi:hypothetical protein
MLDVSNDEMAESLQAKQGGFRHGIVPGAKSF